MTMSQQYASTCSRLGCIPVQSLADVVRVVYVTALMRHTVQDFDEEPLFCIAKIAQQDMRINLWHFLARDWETFFSTPPDKLRDEVIKENKTMERDQVCREWNEMVNCISMMRLALTGIKLPLSTPSGYDIILDHPSRCRLPLHVCTVCCMIADLFDR